MKRTRIRRIGRKSKRDRPALIELGRAVRARADGRCERCGSWVGYFYLHVHHRRPRSLGGKHTQENASALCGACHGAIHSHAADDWRNWID